MLIYVFKEFFEIKDVWLKLNFLKRRKNSYAHLLPINSIHGLCSNARPGDHHSLPWTWLEYLTPKSSRYGFHAASPHTPFPERAYIGSSPYHYPRTSRDPNFQSFRCKCAVCIQLLSWTPASIHCKCAEALTKPQGCETLSPSSSSLPPFCYDMSHILPWVYKVSICLSFSCQYFFQCPD